MARLEFPRVCMIPQQEVVGLVVESYPRSRDEYVQQLLENQDESQD